MSTNRNNLANGRYNDRLSGPENNLYKNKRNLTEKMMTAVIRSKLGDLKYFLSKARRSDVITQVTGCFPSNGTPLVHLETIGSLAKHVTGTLIKGDLFVSILHMAAYLGHTTMVQEIVKKFPSSLNKKTIDLRYAITPIIMAVLGGHAKTVKYLASAGASLQDCMHVAVLVQNKYMIRLLVRLGASVNDRDSKSKCSPLHYARSTNILRYLLSIPGVDMDIRDKYGYTPLMLFAARLERTSMFSSPEREECIRLLLDRGASLKYKVSEERFFDFRPDKNLSILHLIAGIMLRGYSDACDKRLMRRFEMVSKKYKELGMDVNPKSSRGYTPISFFIKSLHRVSWHEDLDRLLDYSRLKRVLRFMMKIGADPTIKARGKETISSLLMEYSEKDVWGYNTSGIVRLADEFKNWTHRVNTNVRLPNNLNLMDPITMNNVSLNNAYILKTDLHTKKNRNNRNVREIKSVYNKASLDGIIRASKSRSNKRLVSPMTRKPFTPQDVVMLVDIVPEGELSRFLNARRTNTTPNKNTNKKKSSRGAKNR